MMRVSVRWFFRLTISAAIVLLLTIGPVQAETAQIKPGTRITPQNAGLVQELVSPGVYWRTRNGMIMDIVPSGRIDWPPPYKDATEKYSAQVRLAANHLSLLGYVAGQPFP